jgi:hypothetical protein
MFERKKSALLLGNEGATSLLRGLTCDGCRAFETVFIMHIFNAYTYVHLFSLCKEWRYLLLKLEFPLIAERAAACAVAGLLAVWRVLDLDKYATLGTRPIVTSLKAIQALKIVHSLCILCFSPHLGSRSSAKIV